MGKALHQRTIFSVVYVGGMPGIYPVAGFPLLSHWFEIYHPSLGRLLPWPKIRY